MSLGNCGAIHTFKEEVIEDTDTYIISRDSLGRTMKLVKGFATIPLPLDHPVHNMEDWKKIKHMYEYDDCRINMAKIEEAKRLQSEGTMILAGIPGGFDMPRQLMGEEEVCYCYYEQPELMEDIMKTITETSLKVLDKITQHIVIDNLTVHEDMAGKSGPLIGPNLIDEWVAPYYKACFDLCHSRGTQLFSQDSDGNMNAVIESFAKAGVNVFYPCEPAAGMDIVKLRQKFGKSIAYKGGIDKHILRQSKDDIRRELEYKMSQQMQEGGVTFALDHRIPNGTPIENYRYYVKTAREILGLEPIEKSQKGWGRMAF